HARKRLLRRPFVCLRGRARSPSGPVRRTHAWMRSFALSGPPGGRALPVAMRVLGRDACPQASWVSRADADVGALVRAPGRGLDPNPGRLGTIAPTWWWLRTHWVVRAACAGACVGRGQSQTGPTSAFDVQRSAFNVPRHARRALTASGARPVPMLRAAA